MYKISGCSNHSKNEAQRSPTVLMNIDLNTNYLNFDNKKPEIFKAVQCGDLKTYDVVKLKSNNTDYYYIEPESQKSLVHIAVEGKHIQVLKDFISIMQKDFIQNGNKNREHWQRCLNGRRRSDGMSPLDLACVKDGNLLFVELLLSVPLVTENTRSMASAFRLCAKHHYNRSFLCLLRHAQPNYLDPSNQQTLLHLAALYNNTFFTRELLKLNQTNRNTKDKFGFLPIHYAILNAIAHEELNFENFELLFYSPKLTCLIDLSFRGREYERNISKFLEFYRKYFEENFVFNTRELELNIGLNIGDLELETHQEAEALPEVKIDVENAMIAPAYLRLLLDQLKQAGMDVTKVVARSVTQDLKEQSKIDPKCVVVVVYLSNGDNQNDLILKTDLFNKTTFFEKFLSNKTKLMGTDIELMVLQSITAKNIHLLGKCCLINKKYLKKLVDEPHFEEIE